MMALVCLHFPCDGKLEYFFKSHLREVENEEAREMELHERGLRGREGDYEQTQLNEIFLSKMFK